MFALDFATQVQQMKAMRPARLRPGQEIHQELPGRIHVVLIRQQAV